MARRVPNDERRARLGVRHHLAEAASSPEAAAAGLVGFHGTDPTSVHLAAWARAPSPGTAALEAALYEDRSLVRLLGMRRTMFVVPHPLVAVVEAAATRPIAERERRQLLTMVEASGLGGRRPDRWLGRVEADVLAELGASGPLAAAELSRRVPALATRLVVGEGTKWAAEVGLASRLLLVLGAEGSIVRARPRGTWVSSQYRWARTEDWLSEPLERREPAAARAELAGHWLARFGPGSTEDLKWWTGWTLGHTRAALVDLGAVEVELEDGPGWVAPGDDEPVDPPPPWDALLPALDATTMGWKGRGWYLGPHGPALFDRNGNAGPTVWLDGRVVGGWAQDGDGVVVTRLLEDVGGEGADRVAERAASLTAWFDGIRVAPRFRTPLERELAGPAP